MMKAKQIFTTLSIAITGGIIAILGYSQIVGNEPAVHLHQEPVQQAIPTSSASTPLQWNSFSNAAETAVASVVHVKTAVERGYYVNPFSGSFFGNQSRTPRIVEGTGSGVILSEDGYIVTNNHVVADAQKVEVTTHDNRKLEAIVIGTDPTTDIAVLKVEANNLQPLPFANSDEVKLGEWVLAVGNPFNLNSTVTAGIISAKGRSINIIDERSAIESFLQTDAVVNPGNSGGALVNTNGDLVGINTAISTHTGTFEGYSFAVPSNLVQKVVNDIIQYGVVQKAYLGVNITNVTPELSSEFALSRTTGVYVANVVEGSAAEQAGIKRGDIITAIDGKSIQQTSELMECIGSKRPGDKVSVNIERNSEQMQFELTLTNSTGNTSIVTSEIISNQPLGAQFEELTTAEKRSMRIKAGVKVSDCGNGKLKEAGIPKGFIITKINNQDVATEDDIQRILADIENGDGILIQGYQPNGRAAYFAFGM